MQPTEPATSQRIKTLLDERGISVSELARRVGWSQPYAARRMDGRVQWRVADLEQVAGVLEVAVVDLLADEPERVA